MSYLPDLQAHAIGNIPEWDIIPMSERNPWQQLASVSYGILTVGNALTAAGLVADLKANQLLARGNVNDGTLSAKTLMAATSLYAAEGFLDIADGSGAELTGTRSPLGRRLDAGTDAIRIPFTIFTLVRAGILPKSAAAILATEKTSTVIPSVIANLRGNEPVVASEGKLTAAQQRLSLGGFVFSATLHQLAVESQNPEHKKAYQELAVLSRGIGWAALVGSAITTVPSTIKYTQAALR